MNRARIMNESSKQLFNRVRQSVITFLLLTVLLGGGIAVRGQQATQPAPQPGHFSAQSIVAKQAALVSEFEVNGLKVLLKRREGSLTVAAGLFIRGGSTNINAQNAGIETLMLSSATEATTNFPRAKMRTELSRMGTGIGSSWNGGWSGRSWGTTRRQVDRSWQIGTDVVLRPSVTSEDVSRVRKRMIVSLSDDTDSPDVYL